ncbi:MAG: TIGR03435 family protein [Acidobacteriia bacterium]|nr:TIGR03435 family protein [Terriglobia bacterium]
MTRTLALATLLALSLEHGHCQDPPKAPAFEVASITPCKPGTPEPPGEHAGVFQFTYPGGRLNARAATLKLLLEWAYDIQPSQHSGGPSWMETDRYDIVAKAEGSATDAEMKRMTQTLLADRFQLKLHHESRMQSVYVISVGKAAPKLFPPKDDETHSLHVAPQMGQDQKIVSFHVVATRFSLTQLADTFARQLGSVIVNQTGLDGEYDFAMDLTPDESRPNPLDPSLLIAGMREQLGLTLKSQKAPVDVLVIDSAEKVAAGN